MRNKKNISIGETFLSWEVIELVNPKKYRYKVRCTECGKEREFIKYNLLKGSYAPCKTCGHKKIRNIPLIRKHWNCELNGVIFDKPENFSLTQSYWFICNEGHNFKSSIKDFKLERCLGCHENPPNHPSKVQAREYAIQYFKTVTRVDEPQQFLLYLELFKTFVYLVEEDRFTTYSNYFKSEAEMLDEIRFVKQLKHMTSKDGLNFVSVMVAKNLKDNVDRLKALMIELVHQVD